MNHLIGEVIDYSHEGLGVVKIDDYVYFVNDVLNDEIIEFVVIKKKKKYGFGKLIRIIKKNINRQQYPCLYEECPSCNLRNLNYQEQINFKKQAIINTYQKANLNYNKINFISNDYIYNYRNKIILHFKQDNKTIKLGYYHNKDIISINKCLLVNETINEFINDFNKIINNYPVSIYDKINKKGLLKHLVVRVNYENKLLIGIIINSNKISKELQSLIDEISNIKNVISIVVSFNELHNSIILSNNNKIMFGKGYFIDKILTYQFRISLNSFFQINSHMISKLYLTAINNAHLTKNDIVLDAYCGTGTIAILLSKYVRKVIGVDVVSDAIKDANYNKELNNIDNVDFINQDINDYLDDFDKEINCLVIDPPRLGIDHKFIDLIIEHKINKIVYISCNGASQSRDIKLLIENGYEINSVTGVDMFSNTYHTEIISILERKL
ncbi:MAG: 23S rRNA (uracil(1939)-C(5))-methyltransferase RlmD [Bacilli bacterium]|jgi:23S rRNA (uracil1939-C5)-methyltransferase|nr:23S rRNA (uracil(1939)-C(5))-methyltransferase RlmD [Bacilli bacterium]